MGTASTPTVAVVDDDPRILESLQSLLESAGYAVRVFERATALLEIHDLEKIDCLISDIGMPGMDGFELQRLIKIARPNLPVILITGRHEIADQLSRHPRESGFLFRKPFEGREILEAVGTSLRVSSGTV